MELRHLRYFLAVAEQLNFSRAAQALHTAQPALSQQIRALERELGGALFERTKRHVALTPLGAELVGDAQAIVEAAERLAVRGRDASGSPRGRLRVGAIVPATIGVIPPVAASYRRAYPAVDLIVDSVGLDEQVRALVERRIDVGILRGPIDDARIATTPVATEYLCAALPAAHRLARRPSLNVADLTGSTHIALRTDRAGSFYTSVAGLLARHRVRLTTITASDVETVFALVASGAGVTILSTVMLPFRLDGVAYRPLLPRTEIGTMVLACRRDRAAVPAIASFIEHVAKMQLRFAPPKRPARRPSPN